MWHWILRWFGRGSSAKVRRATIERLPTVARLDVVTVAEGVLRSLESGYHEHLEGPRRNEEMAWLLLGYANDDSLQIEAAVPAGESRDASAVHVRFDTSVQALATCILRSDDPRLVPLGVFHTHPGSLDHPSGGDFQGDSEWVRRIPGRRGVFGIGTCDGGPTLPGNHQTRVGNLCFSWYHLGVGDVSYRPISLVTKPGDDRARGLLPVWDSVQEHADPLLGLARQLATVRFQVANLEGQTHLAVSIPVRGANAFLRLIFHSHKIWYYLDSNGEWLAVDTKETDPEIAVYRLLAESLLFLRRQPYNVREF